MRALNIFSMITVLFFLGLALYLKPVVIETVEMLSDPVEERCIEDEVVRMNEDIFKNEVPKSVEVDSNSVE